MMIDELKETVEYYKNLLIKEKKRFLHKKMTEGMDSNVYHTEIKRLKELQNCRDKFKDMLEKENVSNLENKIVHYNQQCLLKDVCKKEKIACKSQNPYDCAIHKWGR